MNEEISDEEFAAHLARNHQQWPRPVKWKWLERRRKRRTERKAMQFINFASNIKAGGDITISNVTINTKDDNPKAPGGPNA